MRPNFFSAASAMALTAGASMTSAIAAIALPPFASISLTTASASARLLAHVDHDRAAAGGKLQRHGAADAAAGAGDDGDAAGQFLVSHFAIPAARTDRSVRHTHLHASFSAACARASS